MIWSFVIPLQVNERRLSASAPRSSSIRLIPAAACSMMAMESLLLRHVRAPPDDPMVEPPAMTTPRRYHRVRAVLDRRQGDLTVLMEDVQVPRNLAAILRSCDAVGVFEAHAVWPGGRLKISRPASGGNRKWLPVHKHRTLAAALDLL